VGVRKFVVHRDLREGKGRLSVFGTKARGKRSMRTKKRLSPFSSGREKIIIRGEGVVGRGDNSVLFLLSTF